MNTADKQKPATSVQTRRKYKQSGSSLVELPPKTKPRKKSNQVKTPPAMFDNEYDDVLNNTKHEGNEPGAVGGHQPHQPHQPQTVANMSVEQLTTMLQGTFSTQVSDMEYRLTKTTGKNIADMSDKLHLDLKDVRRELVEEIAETRENTNQQVNQIAKEQKAVTDHFQHQLNDLQGIVERTAIVVSERQTGDDQIHPCIIDQQIDKTSATTGARPRYRYNARNINPAQTGTLPDKQFDQIMQDVRANHAHSTPSTSKN